MKIKLLNGYVLTQAVEEKKGTFIMNDAKVYRELKVLKVSEGSDYKEVLEDKVIYVGKKAGTEITVEDVNYIVVHERDVMAII